MSDDPQFTIGAENGEHLRVEVSRRSHGGATDFWDGNWVNARVSIRAGGFRAGIEATLRTTEFTDFREQLEVLHKVLRGEASFETMEGWLAIRITGDGRGHLDVRATAVDNPGIGNALQFAIPEIDQTHASAIINQLRTIEIAFPTIGSPAA